MGPPLICNGLFDAALPVFEAALQRCAQLRQDGDTPELLQREAALRAELALAQ